MTSLSRIVWIVLLCGCAGTVSRNIAEDAPPPGVPLPDFRPPAIPLFVQTPYLNIWFMGDRLTDDWPKLWNGYVKGMAGLLRIDGQTYRFLGLPESPLPAMKQEAVRVFPTRTEIDFSQDDVRLRLEFLSPMDPRDPKKLSLPLGFLRAEVTSEAPRRIQIYLDITGEWAVGSSDRRITWEGLFLIRPSQPRLFRETYNYPDWGDIYWLALDPPTTAWNGVDKDVRQSFVQGTVPERDARYPRAAADDWPVFAYSWDFGVLDHPASCHAMIAHVREPAVQFFGTGCAPSWRRYHADASAMLRHAAASYPRFREEAMALDAEVLSRARAAGGDGLAALAALTFRQVFSAGELVQYGDREFYMLKDISSPEGSMQALEAMAASAPALLAFSPRLLRLQMEPVIEAIRQGWWLDAFTMSDLGTYPNATGQTRLQDATGEDTANLLLLTAALAAYHPESADFIDGIEDLRQSWARCLRECDFQPPAARGADDDDHGNVRSMLKSILALATLPEYREEAEALMRRWVAEASGEGHTTRVFGESATWSLKPELAFDAILGQDLAPPGILTQDLPFLRSKAVQYGIPMDDRKAISRADALLLTAAMAPRAEREAIIADLVRFYHETPVRVPAADVYEADTGKTGGSQARPVLGSVFAPLLLHEKESR